MFEDAFKWGRTWDPWRELNRLQEEVNRVFSGAMEGHGLSGGYPQMRVYSNEEEALMEVRVPGLSPDAIEISVLGDSVTISGKRPHEHKDDVTYHRREREFGEFTRTLQMPFRVEADKVRAECKNGILAVHLPRLAADRPRKITVKAD